MNNKSIRETLGTWGNQEKLVCPVSFDQACGLKLVGQRMVEKICKNNSSWITIPNEGGKHFNLFKPNQ